MDTQVEHDEMAEKELRTVLEGAAGLSRLCSRALIEEPTQELVDEVVRAADAMGVAPAGAVVADEGRRQRFFDRMVVTSTPFFVPLTESAVTRRLPMDGRTRYGSLSGPRADHALQCYRAVGFSYGSIKGCPAVVQGLRPDSMAVELAFVCALAQSALGEGGTNAVRLLGEFVRSHTRWFADAAMCLSGHGEDLYATVAAMSARLVQGLEEVLAPS